MGEAAPAELSLLDAATDRVVCVAPPCRGCDADADAGAAAPDASSPACCRQHAALPVAVAINGRDWAAGEPPVRFRYYDAPVVSALGALPVGAPMSGPPLGGTPLTFSGAGFATVPNAVEDARCRFGHVVVGAARISELGVLCVSPPHLVGTVAVAVAANGRDFAPAAGAMAGEAAQAAFSFEYTCSGYPDGPTCVARPAALATSATPCNPCNPCNSCN